MPASEDTAAVALGTAARFARGLWGQGLDCQPLPASDLDAAAQRPVLERSADSPPESEPGPALLHLPADTLERALAAAAHAAAHRRFGGPAQPRRGLKPVQQALLGVLEDARVETLACAELPGLRRLWLPWHLAATRDLGNGFDDLLARLSLCLLDPAQPNPHPWVHKACQMFREVFREAGPTGPADGVALRALASRLGHDIGQMRLPFNPRTYQVRAAYRDDNTHLWLPSDEDRPADQPLHATAPPPPPAPPAAGTPEPEPDTLPVIEYPEWDQRIGRYRPRWCRVRVSQAPPAGGASPAEGPGSLRIGRWLRPGSGGSARGGAVADGHELHPVGLVDHALARRTRQAPDGRAFRDQRPPPLALSVLVLVDASVSAAGHTPLWQQQARDLSGALQRLGCRSAVWCFGSAGRQQVRLHRVKDWDQPTQRVDWAALPALGSTRTGTALRHAAQLCRQDPRAPGGATHILVLTDGELHDLDVHEAGYLDADLARSVGEARRLGIRVRLLVPAEALPALPRGSWARRLAQPVRGQRWAQRLAAALNGGD